jgi:hypothetical protein
MSGQMIETLDRTAILDRMLAKFLGSENVFIVSKDSPRH